MTSTSFILLLTLIAQPTCFDPFTPAARHHRISPYLLAAIAEVESGKNVYALNVDGTPYFASTRADAVRKLVERSWNADVGLMQVSLRFWGDRLGLKGYDLLDPHRNVMVGARILSRLIRENGNVVTALGRYHSGNSERGGPYAKSVIEKWNRKPDLVVCFPRPVPDGPRRMPHDDLG